MQNLSKTTVFGLSLPVFVTIVLAILKLIGIVTISWLWVFAPILISIVIAIWQSIDDRYFRL